MEFFCLACGFVGTSLLIASIVVSAVSENRTLYKSLLLIGEIIAFFGYAPVFLKLF